LGLRELRRESLRAKSTQENEMSKPEVTNLERLVVEIQEAGQEWIDAKLKSDQLSDGEKNYLAALINGLEQAIKDKISEQKLERLARGSPEFGQYVIGKCAAIAETSRKKVRYEALQNLWEARRSELAFERAKIEKGIFHTGG
jgi:hypothetical protein